MDRKIFNKVYAKYFKKDYWCTKETIKRRIEEYLYYNPNKKINIFGFKKWLKKEKEECYKMMIERIEEYKKGKKYPKRESFTWSIIKALKIS